MGGLEASDLTSNLRRVWFRCRKRVFGVEALESEKQQRGLMYSLSFGLFNIGVIAIQSVPCFYK